MVGTLVTTRRLPGSTRQSSSSSSSGADLDRYRRDYLSHVVSSSEWSGGVGG